MIYYLPYGEPDIIRVQITVRQRTDRDWEIVAEILKNDLGDLYRFVAKTYACPGDDVLWNVARPSDDRGAPIEPATSEDGLRRLKAIRIIHPKLAAVVETKNAILADLDEYIRSKKVQEVLVVSEEYRFTEG